MTISSNYLYDYLTRYEKELAVYGNDQRDVLDNPEYAHKVSKVFRRCLENGKLEVFRYLLKEAKSLSDEIKEDVFQDAVLQRKYEVICIYHEDHSAVTSVFYDRLLNQSIKNNITDLFNSLIEVNPNLVESALLLLCPIVKCLNPNNSKYPVFLDRICNILTNLTVNQESENTKKIRGDVLCIVASSNDEKRVKSLLRGNPPIDDQDLKIAYNHSNGVTKNFIGNELTRRKTIEVASTAGHVLNMPMRGIVYGIDQAFYFGLTSMVREKEHVDEVEEEMG